ncbi:MAG: hypothetical protein ACK4Z9_07290 [Thermodesulfovibrionales bacterium]
MTQIPSNITGSEPISVLDAMLWIGRAGYHALFICYCLVGERHPGTQIEEDC